jgi:hypothetical protein
MDPHRNWENRKEWAAESHDDDCECRKCSDYEPDPDHENDIERDESVGGSHE